MNRLRQRLGRLATGVAVAGTAVVMAAGCAAQAPFSPRVHIFSPDGAVETRNAKALGRYHDAAGSGGRTEARLAFTPALRQRIVVLREPEAFRAHTGHDLILTVVEGAGAVHAGGASVDLAEGDVVTIPAALPFRLVPAGDTPLTFLEVSAPPAPGDAD